jgi:glycosyltransferase involved in cell wall biosynthesis
MSGPSRNLLQVDARAVPEQSLSERSSRPRDHRGLILLSANSSWNVVNFRAGLISALQRHGYCVAVAAPDDGYVPKLRDLGIPFFAVPMNSAGVSPIEDLRLLLRYRRLMRRLRPRAYLGFTAKPNIYGSLAAHSVGAKVINNISGLGTVFIKRSAITSLVSALYRLSLRRSSTVFFQNPADRDLFVGQGLVSEAQARLVPGSGIDLERFRPSARGREPGPLRFLLLGRLLWDKGVREFVDAARIIRRERPETRFQILGEVGVNNRTAVPRAEIEAWVAEGVVEYIGATDDVRAAIEAADCIVLPSYREGLSRALLEGSAMGKPVIATDVPGCRDVVVDGLTGYLCAARSAEALAGAMMKLLGASENERAAMGERGRLKMEQEYCESVVAARYLSALEAGQ